jgi:oxysterol-binding protein 1
MLIIDDTENACRGSINMKNAKLKLDSADKMKFEVTSTGKNAVRYHLRANHPVEANRWIFALTQAIQAATAEQVSVDDERYSHSRTVSSERPSAGRSVSSLDLRPKLHTSSSAVSINTDDESGEEVLEVGDEPHRGDFDVTAHSAQVQLEILEKLIGALPQTQLDISSESPVAILKRAASSLHGSLDELVRMSQTRDKYWRNRVEREKELRRLWEENMQALAREQEQLEEAMNQAIEQRRMTKRALRAMSMAVQQPDKGAEYIRRLSITEKELPIVRKPEDIVPPEELEQVLSESEDEFFDALSSEAATLLEDQSVSQPMPLSPPAAVSKEVITKEQELALSWHGYEGPLRKKFEKLDKDNRPKISLWGILKSMVGKDMTKMVIIASSLLTKTLPVSFNECTSLLQRGCEDMEYVDLLSIAVTKEESWERAGYVAAFAASEYASTVNRVAKPFNPLLVFNVLRI